MVLALTVALAGCVAVDSSRPGIDLDAGATTEDPPSGEVTVTVLRVVDGDTLKVAYENGTEDTVRLVGVDTPEVHVENDPEEFDGVPDSAAGSDCLARWGERASDLARETLAGATVQLAFDGNLDRRGYYDRLLAYVVVDGTTFNRKLVADGYARVYDSEFTRRAAYRDLEAAAQRNDTGLWECATANPPTGTAAVRIGAGTAIARPSNGE